MCLRMAVGNNLALCGHKYDSSEHLIVAQLRTGRVGLWMRIGQQSWDFALSPPALKAEMSERSDGGG